MKIPYTKLKLSKKEEIKKITINDIEVEVKQYLPVAEKLNLIANTMNNSMDGNDFMNPLKVDILGHLEIIYFYTNINFTDKQKEDPAKLYDILETNGIIDAVVSAIPADEYNTVVESIDATIQEFYKYKNSAYAIMASIASDYKDLEFDAEKIQKDIADPENLTLLKDVVTKLG